MEKPKVKLSLQVYLVSKGQGVSFRPREWTNTGHVKRSGSVRLEYEANMGTLRTSRLKRETKTSHKRSVMYCSIPLGGLLCCNTYADCLTYLVRPSGRWGEKQK